MPSRSHKVTGPRPGEFASHAALNCEVTFGSHKFQHTGEQSCKDDSRGSSQGDGSAETHASYNRAYSCGGCQACAQIHWRASNPLWGTSGESAPLQKKLPFKHAFTIFLISIELPDPQLNLDAASKMTLGMHCFVVADILFLAIIAMSIYPQISCRMSGGIA